MALSPENHSLVADLLQKGAVAVRLPSENEWAKLAGGVADENRYPWNPPAGPATQDEAAILARANTQEAGLNGTSPVAMYPLGAVRPFGLMDLAGNVWEWTATEDEGLIVLRGGAWYWEKNHVRVGSRNRNLPLNWYVDYGFRLVSPVVSDS